MATGGVKVDKAIEDVEVAAEAELEELCVDLETLGEGGEEGAGGKDGGECEVVRASGGEHAAVEHEGEVLAVGGSGAGANEGVP